MRKEGGEFWNVLLLNLGDWLQQGVHFVKIQSVHMTDHLSIWTYAKCQPKSIHVRTKVHRSIALPDLLQQQLGVILS